MDKAIPLVLGLGFLGYLLGTLERRALYFPDRELAITPAGLRLDYEAAALKTSDGVALQGWFIPAASPEAPVLLFFHGNAGNISHRLGKAQAFHQKGLSIFLFDYRGYGKSKGKPSEKGLYRDAEAAYRHLLETRGIPAKKIVLYGESLGCAVAVELARTHPAAALVLESPFTSTVAMGKRIYPWLPVSWVVKDRYDNLSKIPEIHLPLLILHSPQDEIVPYAMGQQLYATAAAPKKFFELSGGHNDGFDTTGPRVFEGIVQFLKEVGLH